MRVVEARLRLIEGQLAPASVPADPMAFQADCVDAFVTSWTARGFAATTIGNDAGLLDRMLAALGRPAWEVTPEDVDRVVGGLAGAGRAVSTRRNYLQVFRGFHRFLEVRKAAEIEAVFGVRLDCPVDEFNSAHHVSDDSPAQEPPPVPERVAEFFGFLRDRIATARKYAPAARDYALFRTLYHAGTRCEEAVLLDVPDVHFGRGRSASCMSGSARLPAPRDPGRGGCRCWTAWTWCCAGSWMTCAAASLIRRCCSAASPAGACRPARVRNRLRHLMGLEGRPEADWFTPHSLRRACATHNYERGVDLVAIQQMLGHWSVASTMRYVNYRELHQTGENPQVA